MKKLTHILYFFLSVLLAGCQITDMSGTSTPLKITNIETPISTSHILSSTVTLSPTIISSQIPTVNSSETPTIVPLQTIVPMTTASQTAIPTSVVPPEARLQFQCLKFVPAFSDDATSSGILVLDSQIDVNGRSSFDTFLLDMTTRKTTQISGPSENQENHAISPDRKHIAYSSAVFNTTGQIVEKQLVIATADGQRVEAFPWEDGWTGIPGWVNDQQVVINISGLDPDESTHLKAATLLALNPFTGGRQILRPDFPGIYNYAARWSWDGWSSTRYDPALTRVVYARLTGNGSEYAYAIWDLQKGQLVASLESVFTDNVDFLPVPRWSPDGSWFVMEGFLINPVSFELFLVSRDGQIKKLTNLFAYQKSSLISYTWSPDGRSLAAWLYSTSLRKNREVELVLIDTVTGQTTNLCIRLKYTFWPPPLPIWSPDSTQLIVKEEPDQDHSRVILVDLEKGIAAQIAEDMEPVGWMVAP